MTTGMSTLIGGFFGGPLLAALPYLMTGYFAGGSSYDTEAADSLVPTLFVVGAVLGLILGLAADILSALQPAPEGGPVTALPVLGNVNANIPGQALFRGRVLRTDRGFVGMTRALVEAGAVPGDLFLQRSGGAILRRDGEIFADVATYQLVDDGGGERTPNGWWVTQLRGERGWLWSEDARVIHPELFQLTVTEPNG